jgi:hypothetical protein
MHAADATAGRRRNNAPGAALSSSHCTTPRITCSNLATGFSYLFIYFSSLPPSLRFVFVFINRYYQQLINFIY